MPFGNKARPSRVYAYGCRVKEEQVPRVMELLRNANHFRNKLVEIEIERRRQVEATVHELTPEAVALAAVIELHIAELDRIKSATEKLRQEARRRVPMPPEMKESLTTTRAALKALHAQLKIVKATCYTSEEFKTRQAAINASTLAADKRARSESNVNWGTYLAVEQAMSKRRQGAPPRFKRYRGDGQVAVQFQKGLSVEKAYAGTDSRLSLTPGGAKDCVVARLQLSREEHLNVTFKLHRPLPADCSLQWCRLVCRRIGTHNTYTLQFVCAADSWPSTTVGDQRVAVNLGWRNVEGGLRVATWLGEDGQQGTLVLPHRHVGRIAEVESLRSIRDKNFDTMRLQLQSWLTANQVPAALAEDLATLSHWKSPARLAATAIRWRAARFDGDGTIYDALEGWRKQDRHLLEWEANSRQKFYDRRRDIYRNFARLLSRDYATVLLAKSDWRKMQQLPLPEADTDELKLPRSRKELAAPSALELALVQKLQVSWFAAENMTATCSVCNQLSGELQPDKLRHTCTNCGANYDQDLNHCQNLLAASGQVLEAV